MGINDHCKEFGVANTSKCQIESHSKTFVCTDIEAFE
jgi:hypothetical protein